MKALDYPWRIQSCQCSTLPQLISAATIDQSFPIYFNTYTPHECTVDNGGGYRCIVDNGGGYKFVVLSIWMLIKLASVCIVTSHQQTGSSTAFQA